MNPFPAHILGRLNKAMREVPAEEDLERRVLEMGIEADPTSPEEFTTFRRAIMTSGPASSPGTKQGSAGLLERCRADVVRRRVGDRLS
jgi:hypothetical protein